MQPVEVGPGGLPGLFVVSLDLRDDRRGNFREAWQVEKLAAQNLPPIEPKQFNVSESYYGVIRGIHAEPWYKYVHVAAGYAFAAMVDLRADQPSFGQVVTFRLGPRDAVLVPPGIGNSFQATSPVAVYCYLVTELWHGEQNPYPAVHYADADLAIEWPIDNPIVSDKDQRNPPLNAAYPEAYQRGMGAF